MSTASSESASLPEEGTLQKRALRGRSLLSFLLALAVLLFFGSRLQLDPQRVWDTIKGANIGLYAGAFFIYYLTFPLRAARWRLLLHNVGLSSKEGIAMPSLLRLMEMLYLSWFANCVIPAKLGDAYRGYQLKRWARVSFSTIMGTILAERFIDTVVLVLLLVGATFGLGRLGGGAEGVAGRIFAGGILLLLLGAMVLAGMWALRGKFHTVLPLGIQAKYLRFQEGTLGSFRQLPLVLLATLAVWLTETGRLFLVVQSLGLDLAVPYVVFLALASSLLTVVPLTPGGLGLAEAGIVGLLLLVGVNKEAAVAAALLDRTISYWSIVLFGFVLFLLRRRI